MATKKTSTSTIAIEKSAVNNDPAPKKKGCCRTSKTCAKTPKASLPKTKKLAVPVFEEEASIPSEELDMGEEIREPIVESIPEKTISAPSKKPKLSKNSKTQKKAKNNDPFSQNILPPGSGFMGIPPYQPEMNEEYMGPKQKEHFRKILNVWKQSLMEEVDRIVSHMQSEAANFPDPNDRATQEEEFSLALRARDRERKLIKKIDDALEDLEQSEYGFCETCGVEIGIRRLEARPTAKLCIDCKTLEEMRERQMGG